MLIGQLGCDGRDDLARDHPARDHLARDHRRRLNLRRGQPDVHHAGPAGHVGGAGQGRPDHHAAEHRAARRHNVYGYAGANMMSPNVAGAKSYVYVPSAAQNGDGYVDVIDQATMTVIDRYKAGSLGPAVVPSWDLRRSTSRRRPATNSCRSTR